MLNNLKINKLLWNIITLLTLIAAVFGVIFPHIYDGVFPNEFIPGALPQDILTILLCVALFIMIAKIKEDSYKLQVVVMGIIMSFFYLYGIFTMERVYNFLYILYAAIFAMSFWSILYSLMNLREEVYSKVTLSKAMNLTSSISGILIGVLFSFLWIAALIPLMKEHKRIDFLYSIYVLDLCFVMPAFFITAILSLRKKGLGPVLMPAIYILGVFVIFPLGLCEIAKPYFEQEINYGAMIMSFAFSIYMLLIAIMQLKKIRISKG